MLATGHLDGDATLQIVSNHGRDQRMETLSGDFEEKRFGEPEAWVTDLNVRFLPGTARSGEVTLALYCGRNLPRNK